MGASRRAFLSLPLAFGALLLILFAAGGRADTFDDSGRTRDYRFMMGTSVEVEAYGGTDAIRREAIDAAFKAIAEIDRLMSNYRDDSELSLINRLAADRPVRVSEPMLAVLAAGLRVSAKSHGAFDMTVGPLVKLWGFHDQRPHLPSARELAVVRPLVDYRQVLIDDRARSVRFARAGVELDLGGIAKGFAVEVAANTLRQKNLRGFIDAGGNQYLLGTPPGKRTWTVGIKDPDRPDRLLGVVETQETSVSTSADYATFVELNGRKYGHLLDPRTLQPSDAALSATVLSRDGTLADAMSKAAFLLGPTEGLALVDSFPGMSAVVAYRRPNGTIALAISPRIRTAFHPVAPGP
ncbi:MAG: FAD:protein FMN transferase [Acidobacteriota bacterium]